MGVDYHANYGIGVKIHTIDFEDHPEYDTMDEFLDDKLDGSKYQYFEVGDEFYSGNPNDLYISIKNPFSDGLDQLEKKRNELLGHLKEINVSVDGDFGEIGGILVC